MASYWKLSINKDSTDDVTGMTYVSMLVHLHKTSLLTASNSVE